MPPIDNVHVKAFVAGHLPSIHSIHDVARELGVSPQTLRKCFLRRERISLRDYITKVPNVFAASPGAKISGIMLSYPGLKLGIEGNTDSVGGDDYNQRLSEHRGESVRDYLIQQGMPVSSVTTRGFGKTQPVASNETAAGRQQNRRVELVISGDIIGAAIGSPIASN